jgi:hypothetical protein
VAGAAERRRRGRRLLVPALLAVLAAAGAALVTGAAAQIASPRHEGQFDLTVRFLQEDQNADGGFGGEKGSPSDPDFTSWVALALAAADVNPHDQARPGGVDAYSYLAAHAGELTLTTDFERALLVVDASESPPQPLGGVNLVERLLERRLPSGAFTHEAGGVTPGMNDTIFAILALSPIKEATVEGVVRGAAEWVISEQDEDGSWPSWCPKSVCANWQDSTDMTGAAIEALNAAGMPGTEAQAKALAYLHGVQLADGGWPQSRGEGESNVGSTAWVVQGIWAAGENPETWKTGSGLASEEPLDYLTSLQQEDGHIRYMRSHDLNGVWMTSYATPALAGRALPIVPPPARVPPPVPSTTEPGAGSSDGQGKKGVIAGGGGHGAPLFGRNKSKSKGRTPGGARAVRGASLEAEDHSPTRRGANHHQASGTETVEPHDAAEADQEARSVSPETTSGAHDEREAVTGAPGGGGGDKGDGPGERGAPLPAPGAKQAGATTTGEEVDGVVIGSPEGGKEGALAFGAPGLHSAGGGGDGLGTAIGIGAAAALAALLGAGLERRRGRGALA